MPNTPQTAPIKTEETINKANAASANTDSSTMLTRPHFLSSAARVTATAAKAIKERGDSSIGHAVCKAAGDYTQGLADGVVYAKASAFVWSVMPGGIVIKGTTTVLADAGLQVSNVVHYISGPLATFSGKSCRVIVDGFVNVAKPIIQYTNRIPTYTFPVTSSMHLPQSGIYPQSTAFDLRTFIKTPSQPLNTIKPGNINPSAARSASDNAKHRVTSSPQKSASSSPTSAQTRTSHKHLKIENTPQQVPATSEPSLSVASQEYNNLLNAAIGETDFVSLTPAQWEKIRQEYDLKNPGNPGIAETLAPAIRYINPEMKHTVNLSHLQESADLLYRIGAVTDNHSLQQFASISSSIIATTKIIHGFADPAIMLAMGGPMGIGLALASAVVSLFGAAFRSDAEEGSNLSNVLAYYHRELISVMDANHEEIREQFKRLHEMGMYTQGKIDDWGRVIVDLLQYLHHSFTITHIKEFADIKLRSEMHQRVLNAKLDLINLQPLHLVVSEIKPYLDNPELRQFMTQTHYIKLMGILSGILAETIKHPALTHSAYLNPVKQTANAKSTADVLSEIYLDPITLPNYFGLIVASLNSLETFPELPEKIFNVVAWYKALSAFLPFQEAFPHLNYPSAERQVSQLLHETQQFEKLLERLRLPESINALFDELATAQQKIKDTTAHRYEQANQEFQSKHLIEGIDLLEFTIDGLSGHPEINKARVPHNLFKRNTTYVGELFKKKIQGSISFDRALGFPYEGSVFTYLQQDKYNITIPQPFLAAEAIGEGVFIAQTHCAINDYELKPNECDNFGVKLKLDDAERPGKHGLSVTFKIKHHRLEILSPMDDYLNRKPWNPFYNLYATKHTPPHVLNANPPYPNGKEWDSHLWKIPKNAEAGMPSSQAGNRMCQIPFPNPAYQRLPEGNYLTRYADNLAISTEIVTQEINSVILNAIKKYSLAVLTDLSDSPAIQNLRRIEKLIIGLATFLGYPPALIEALYDNLHSSNHLEQFENFLNGQTHLRPTLNLVSNDTIKQLREQMLAAASFGVTDHYLQRGKFEIQYHLLHIEEKKLAQQLKERKANEQRTSDISRPAPENNIISAAKSLIDNAVIPSEEQLENSMHTTMLVNDCNYDAISHSPSLQLAPSILSDHEANVCNPVDSLALVTKNMEVYENVFGIWSDRIKVHPRTGKPIFTYQLYNGAAEVADDYRILGSADFYGSPILCRSSDGLRHNVIHTTGLMADWENNINTTQINEICATLPPTLFNRLSNSARNGAQLGLAKGLSSAIGKQLRNNGYSDLSASIAAQACFFSAYGAIKVTENYLRMEAEATIANILGCILRTAYETGNMVLINVAFLAVNYLLLKVSELLENNQWQTASSIVKKCGQLVQFGLFAAQVSQQPIEEVGLSLTASSAAEMAVENLFHV